MFELNEKNKNKYSIVKQYVVEEENIEVVELVHNKTEAKMLLFICDDENRVFNIAFKTPISNSKGTPHILEHSVLCGSKKYNVKDPFIELAKSSMKTYLNAMTFPDKTCYPVASANLKDFHNLVDVYMDAVFYPNVVKNDKLFKQEGWHYEIENKDAELKVNGVVFNEMRGVYSDPDSILESGILSNLYKGTNYQYESGGDPNEIFNLSFDEFVAFHKKYYSPTNSIVYFYGKLDFNYELDYIDTEYFCNFDKIDVDARFEDAKGITPYAEKIDYYNIDTEENKDKAYLAYSFSFDEEKTSLKYFALRIIDYVLFSSESAILKEKFLNEGFGETVYSKFDLGIKNGFYSIISQNVLESKKDEFIKLFDNYIKEIIENGIDVNKFKAGINSCYFDYAEGELGSFPRGLFFILVSLETYLYGDGATTLIEYKKAFDTINKEDLSSKGNIFIKVLKECFVDNKHRCVNVLRPKMGYSEEKDANLKEILEKRKSSFSYEEIKNIIDDVAELKKYQSTKDSKEDLKCVPTLKLSDIDRDKKLIEYETEVNENVQTIITYKNDKDIIYTGIKFDISDLSKEEIYLFALINCVIAKVDLVNESYRDFNNYVDINTGGLSIGVDVTNSNAFFSLDVKTTKDKIDYAFNIFYKLISESQFVDSKRINIILNESKQTSLLSILTSGNTSAMTRSKSSADFRSGIMDKVGMNGVGFYRFLSAICNVYDANRDLFNESMSLMFKKLNRKKLYLTLCTNKKYHDDTVKYFKTFMDSLSNYKIKNEYTDKDEEKLFENISKINKLINFDSFEKKCKSEAIVTPNDINFCALSGKFPKDLFSGKLYLLRILFNYEYLWTNIRVLGGAYGCMSLFDKLGNYSFASYRDPNVSKTNDVFYGVYDFLKKFEGNEEEIHKYIIGTMGGMDNPLSIVENHKRSISAYFNELTDEEYNKARHDILDITGEDIRDLSKIFENIKDGDRCALISSSKMEEAKKEYEQVWRLMD